MWCINEWKSSTVKFFFCSTAPLVVVFLSPSEFFSSSGLTLCCLFHGHALFVGYCATTIPSVTESCLSGLISLLRNRDEAVVAESVVIIKKLLQLHPGGHKVRIMGWGVGRGHCAALVRHYIWVRHYIFTYLAYSPCVHPIVLNLLSLPVGFFFFSCIPTHKLSQDIIVLMAKMAVSITVPMARASILWLIGEYSAQVCEYGFFLGNFWPLRCKKGDGWGACLFVQSSQRQ